MTEETVLVLLILKGASAAVLSSRLIWHISVVT